VNARDLEAALTKRYAGGEFISVKPAEGDRLEPEALNDTNKMELRVYPNEQHRQVLLVARLDNLGKGASGAAVQNLRLMLSLPSGTF
jgi:N-acetyl-gamma-glutamyl-phosphate reductase